MNLYFSSQQTVSTRVPRGRASFVAVGSCLVAAMGCAVVTQEEPDSLIGVPGGGGNPTASAGSTGAGRGGGGLLPTGGVGGSGLAGSGLAGSGLGGSGLGGSGAGGRGSAGSTGSVGSGGAFGGSGPSGAPGGGAGQAAGGGGAGTAGQGGTTPDPGPQFPSGTELFRDDFESADVSRWALDEGTWARTVDAETGSNVFAQSDTSPSNAVLAVSGDVTWRDVRVEADFKVLAFNGSSSSYLAGLCVRLTDAESFYLVGLRSDGNQNVGIRKFGSSNTNLSQSEFSGTENVWYHLQVDAIGGTLSVYVDDELVLEQTDAEHAVGGIGLCTVRASAVFDNILVTAP